MFSLLPAKPCWIWVLRLVGTSLFFRGSTERIRSPDHGSTERIRSSDDIAVDWSHLTGPAGYQGGHCNSCYVWAAIGCIETRAAIASGSSKVDRLSVQQALDCANADHMKEIGKGKLVYRTARGCQTGFPKAILQYAIDEGFMTEDVYPVLYNPDQGGSYERHRQGGSCLVNSSLVVTHPSSAQVRSINAQPHQRIDWSHRVMEALTRGPVAAGIHKSSYTIGLRQEIRQGGIATKDCESQDNDHAVLIVGYGKEQETPYWIVKNSWGTAWGNGGYFKVRRGWNLCGIESTAVYLDFKQGA